MPIIIPALAALISVGILCSVIAICACEMARAEDSEQP